MKKVLICICILSSISMSFFMPTVFAGTPKQVELVEKYLINHKKKIELFSKKYEFSDHSELQQHLNKIETLITILQKIQNSTISEDQIWEKLIIILTEIKSINNDIKSILLQEKTNFERELSQTSIYYWRISEKLAQQLSEILIQLIQNTPKEKLSPIIEELKSLEWEVKKLHNFKNISFRSTSEVQNSFLRILKTIKSNLLSIKEKTQ